VLARQANAQGVRAVKAGMFAPVVGYNTAVSQGAVSTWSTTNFANLVAHSRLTNRQVQRW